jgi:hypothetical protein
MENKSLCTSTFLDPRVKMTFLRSGMKNKIQKCTLEALKQCQMEVRGDSVDDISTGYALSSSTVDQDTEALQRLFQVCLMNLLLLRQTDGLFKTKEWKKCHSV